MYLWAHLLWSTSAQINQISDPDTQHCRFSILAQTSPCSHLSVLRDEGGTSYHLERLIARRTPFFQNQSYTKWSPSCWGLPPSSENWVSQLQTHCWRSKAAQIHLSCTSTRNAMWVRPFSFQKSSCMMRILWVWINRVTMSFLSEPLWTFNNSAIRLQSTANILLRPRAVESFYKFTKCRSILFHFYERVHDDMIYEKESIVWSYVFCSEAVLSFEMDQQFGGRAPLILYLDLDDRSVYMSTQ